VSATPLRNCGQHDRSRSDKYKEAEGIRLPDILPVEDSLRRRTALMALTMRFLKDEGAATAIEYGLIAAGITIAIIPVITGLGTKLKTTLTAVQTALK
jgi:pilus assembly protein Flp/PilA